MKSIAKKKIQRGENISYKLIELLTIIKISIPSPKIVVFAGKMPGGALIDIFETHSFPSEYYHGKFNYIRKYRIPKLPINFLPFSFSYRFYYIFRYLSFYFIHAITMFIAGIHCAHAHTDQ